MKGCGEAVEMLDTEDFLTSDYMCALMQSSRRLKEYRLISQLQSAIGQQAR